MKLTRLLSLSLMLTLALMVTLMPIRAQAATVASGTCGENLTWVLDDTGTLTISGTGVMGNYAAKESPFYDIRHDIKTISIASGVTTIGDYAFYYCYDLTSVTIPGSVNSIGNNAFENCDKLTGVTIPNGVTSIGNSAFDGCDGLTSVTIPGSVNSIGNSAFYYCSRLTRVTIGKGVTSIGNSAFNHCYRLTSVTIPDSVTSIGSSAFRGCDELSNITIPGSVTAIGSSVFSHCDSLTMVTIGDGVTTIGEDVFCYCANLTSVTIPDSVTSIGKSAFYGCESLTGVTIPDSVTSIGKSAFYGCESLTGVTIPSSVTTIGQGAFLSCDSLQDIQVAAGNPSYSSDGVGVLFNKKKTTLIQAPAALSGNYSIPAGVTSIVYHAFSDCSGLTDVTIPNSVTYIGYAAFSSCASLTGVTIPGSVTTISDFAFSYCDGLTSVTIPDSVTSIGTHAFFYCKSLTSVTIGNGVTSVGESGFSSCDNLEAVYYYGTHEQWSKINLGEDNEIILDNLRFIYGSGSCGDNLTWQLDDKGNLTVSGTGPMDSFEHGEQPWYNWLDHITSVQLSDGVTTIGDNAFAYCKNLLRVNIPQLVTSIGNSAFTSCSSLTGVDIPGSVTSIGKNSFSSCTNLTCVTMGSGISAIGSSAFVSCDNLADVYYDGNQTQWNQISIGVANEDLTGASIHFCVAGGTCGNNMSWILSDDGTLLILGTGAMDTYPSVEDAPWYAYKDSITALILADGVTSFGRHAFCVCTELTSVTIPGSVEWINRQTFDGCKKLKSVTFTGNIPNLEVMAFHGCTGLEEVHITDLALWCDLYAGDNLANPLHYANNLYLNGKLITDLVLPDHIKKINSFAFVRCNSLRSVTFPAGLETLGAGVFKDCESLKYVVFKGDKPSIENTTYYEWSGTPSSGGVVSVRNYGSFEYVNTVAYYPYDADWGTGKIPVDRGGGQITWIGYDPALTVPAKPYKIVNVVSGVHVYWNAVPGVTKYGLWRSDNGPNGYYQWVGNPRTNHFTDTKVESGKTYYYCVSTCDPNTNAHSMMSDPIGITYLSTPDITERLNRLPGIQLTWNQVTGATGYRIYRKSYTGNDAWVKVGEVSGNSTLTWVDGAVKTPNGAMYKYTVRAVYNGTLSGCRGAGRSMMRLTGLTLKEATRTGSGKVKVSWSTTKMADGYEVRFMNGSTIVKQFTIGNYKTGVKTFTGIPTGATYKVQVRCYKKIDGMGFYSAWSEAKNVKLP